MALARLAKAFAGRSGTTLEAATVDHGLRAGSAAEAARVAEWCAAIGLRHRILKWTGDKPARGVQAAARSMRYCLLCEASAALGCGAILTAHTANDQAETVFMRMAKGAGPRGMAGMAGRSMIADGPSEAIPVLRPLLGVGRRRLVATLGATGQEYLDDPSNVDPTFERVRVRALLAALGEQNLVTRESLLECAGKLRSACALLDQEERRASDCAGATFHGWGGVSLRASAVEKPGAAALFRQLFYAAGGGAYPPQIVAVERALGDIATRGAATLGGAVATRLGETLWLHREPAALTGRAGVAPKAPQRLSPGTKILWDRRYIIHNCGTRDVTIAVADAGALRRAGIFPGPEPALNSLPYASAGDEPGAALFPGSLKPGLKIRSIVEERFHRRVNRFERPTGE